MSEPRAESLHVLSREEQFQVVFRQYPDAVLLIDPHDPDGAWPIVDCNDAACEMNGYTRDELIGLSIDRLNVEPSDAAARANYLAWLRQVNVHTDEDVHRRKDGTLVKVEFSTSLITIGGRELVLGVDRAISLRKQLEELHASELHFRMLFEQLTDSLVLIDPHHASGTWTVVECNEAACVMHGYTRKKLRGRPFDMLQTQKREPGEWALALDQLRRSRSEKGENVHRRQDGTIFPTAYTSSLIMIQDRELILRIDRDISDHHQAQMALRESEERFRALFEHSPDSIVLVDPHDPEVPWKILDANAAAAQLHGYAPGEIIGMSANQLRAEPTDDDQFLNNLRMTTRHGPDLHRRKGGSVFPVDYSAALLTIGGRELVLGIDRDMSERKRMEERLAHDAFHDALTGLPNRALFFDRIGKALQRSRRSPWRQCAVLFLDLDRFKTINDSLGHAFGDHLLVQVGRRLQERVRLGDTVARFGGDEFAILLEDLSDTGIAAQIASKLCEAIEAPFVIAGKEIVTSTSIGIALSTTDNTRPDEMLRDADIAMYRAKRMGRGRHALADPTLHRAIRDQLQLEADLRQALERDEFSLYYQPKVAIDGRTIIGVEALVRWRHPTRGVVPPGEFIAVAEESGLIVALGAWVLRTACLELKAWHESGLPPIFVAVNISAVQFRQPDLAQMITGILDQVGLDPRFLALELTESILMEDAEATRAVLRGLLATGIDHIAVDDFGTGYSSLSYLQRFPISAIKIDRSFVNDIMTNASSAVIANAIIALAHSLGLTTVAEGVETEEQRLWLEQHGCDAFQGYLHSRPLPLDELSRTLAATPAAVSG